MVINMSVIHQDTYSQFKPVFLKAVSSKGWLGSSGPELYQYILEFLTDAGYSEHDIHDLEPYIQLFLEEERTGVIVAFPEDFSQLEVELSDYPELHNHQDDPLESPQPFIIREECHKATWQHGFRRVLGESDGWAAFGSTTAQGTIWLAAESAQGPWFLALDHPGVAAELALPSAVIAGPGLDRYSFATLTELYAILLRLYQLSASLPDAPLKIFHQQTVNLPKTTEAERLVVQRIGQDIFRNSLMDYWQGRCPLTGITDPALLRASHIVQWSECQNDAQRLDVHNGLLLSALWDAAFDRALVTFDDDGNPEFSPMLSDAARQALKWDQHIPLSDSHRQNLAAHRQRFTPTPPHQGNFD